MFDTVGALGVPGALANRHKFHDVRAEPGGQLRAPGAGDRRTAAEVRTVAVGGRRRRRPERPRQAGLVRRRALRRRRRLRRDRAFDTSLLWMVREANGQGLVFNEGLLDSYIGSGSSAVRHDSMNNGYRLLNVIARLRMALKANPRFRSGRRLLNPAAAIYPKISSSAADHCGVRRRALQAGERRLVRDRPEGRRRSRA